MRRPDSAGAVRRGGDDPDKRAPPVGGLREGRRRVGPGRGDGPAALVSWAAGREEEKGGLGRFGLKTSFPIFPFCKRFKQIQVEFKFEEFKFKLNHNIKTMQG